MPQRGPVLNRESDRRCCFCRKTAEYPVLFGPPDTQVVVCARCVATLHAMVESDEKRRDHPFPAIPIIDLGLVPQAGLTPRRRHKVAPRDASYVLTHIVELGWRLRVCAYRASSGRRLRFITDSSRCPAKW